MTKRKTLRTFARIRPFHDDRYPGILSGTWYLVRQDGLDAEGCCWLVAYGLKIRVDASHFDLRAG